MTRRLPEVVQERILSFPEYGMGAYKVALIILHAAPCGCQ